MSQVEWYYARDNRQTGPVSSAELKRLATFDELRPDDLVWREGMTEWAAARNVRGLFEEEVAPAAAAAGGESAPKASETPAKPQDNAVPRPARHLFDAVMGKFRPHFNAHFIETTAGVFRACGSYGLFTAAVLSATFAVILTVRTSGLDYLLWGVIWVLILLSLQYVAGRAFGAIEQLDRTTAGRLSSSAVPDCVVVFGTVGGVAALLGSIASAVKTTDYMLIVVGVAGFFICAYLAAVALNWSMLNISIAPETLPGDEWIGVFMFVLKAILRLAPVAFGAGVICGTLAMGFACYLACVGETGTAGAAEASYRAPLVMADGFLVRSALLPLVAYLFFLFANLVMNLWHSVLSLPGKLDILSENGDEIGRGQPDTVTTHE